MSTNSNSSRDSGNAGSDSAGRFKTSPMDAFKRSIIPGTGNSMNDPVIKHTPKVPTSNGVIRDKA
ncbi:hypothetical protein [Paraburkholderia sp. DHOC27]|uniref:hypothetical protein n=1 Tax=Paraburkholderia sp. DHOC27 TaxID=2303330 RepID=UPI000E3DC8C3|nr:hypothetical protein [Paraburkholderia sp. DHOC27]RFU48645.1 hypothetical protein D0B32_02060 [Paraburkholderia sp. DHOC27]